jgi:hypothetical protein
MKLTKPITEYPLDELQTTDGRKVIGVWELLLKTPFGNTHIFQLEDGDYSAWKQSDTKIIHKPKERWQGLIIGDEKMLGFSSDAFDRDHPFKERGYTHAINLSTLEVVKL